MPKGCNTPNKYTKQYFENPLPLTHNPIIASSQIDTFTNVRDTLCTLRELTEVQEFGLAEHSLTGLHFLMTCVIEAVDFEIRGRM